MQGVEWPGEAMALYAFDGTKDRWDARKPITLTAKTQAGRYLSNVVLFYQAYRDSGLPAHYFPGVGSTMGLLDRTLGVAFGAGAWGIVNRAWRQLKANFRQGDRTIDIVGYSRGAAIARVFADRTYRRYGQIVDATGHPLTEPPPIRFIGLFDTVASFGIPLNDNELFFQERIPPTTQQTFHAMSLDVKRPGFGLDRAYGANILEVWFRGGHKDIGGNAALQDGAPNRTRGNIPLVFMLKKAIASGLALTVDFERYPTDPGAPVTLEDNTLESDPSRAPRQYDVFHHSLFDAAGQVIPLPGVVTLPERRSLVIEEPINESELSEQRLIQLTPTLAAAYPDTQTIYTKLYEGL